MLIKKKVIHKFAQKLTGVHSPVPGEVDVHGEEVDHFDLANDRDGLGQLPAALPENGVFFGDVPEVLPDPLDSRIFLGGQRRNDEQAEKRENLHADL